MCSSGGQIAQTDKDIQAANAATAKTLQAHADMTFAQQQAVLGRQMARMGQMVSNPMGYSKAYIHTATTSINDSTAQAAKQALASSAAFAATHGGADVGGGGVGQEAGQIGAQAGFEKSRELGQLSAGDEARKQENFLTGLQGMKQAGDAYGAASTEATSGAIGDSTSAVSAGSGALAAQDAGWQHTMGMISAAGGLVADFTGTKGLAGLLKGGGQPKTV